MADGSIQERSPFRRLKESTLTFVVLSAVSLFGVIFAVYQYAVSRPSVSMVYDIQCDYLLNNTTLSLNVIDINGKEKSINNLYDCTLKLWNKGTRPLEEGSILQDMRIGILSSYIKERRKLSGAQEGKHVTLDGSKGDIVEIKVRSLFPNSGMLLEYFSTERMRFDVTGSYLNPSGKVSSIEEVVYWEDYVKDNQLYFGGGVLGLAIIMILIEFGWRKRRGQGENARLFLLVARNGAVAIWLGIGFQALASVQRYWSQPPF